MAGSTEQFFVAVPMFILDISDGVGANVTGGGGIDDAYKVSSLTTKECLGLKVKCPYKRIMGSMTGSLFSNSYRWQTA